MIFAGGTNRINATASTLNSTDLLVGGSGSDTFAITGAGTGASHAVAGLASGLTSFEQLDLAEPPTSTLRWAATIRSLLWLKAATTP